MATLNKNLLTLEDHAKSYVNGKKTEMIVEMLSQNNAILQDMPFREGNLITGHRTTVRTGLPDVYWRNYNQGIPASKSRKATVDEKCGILEAYSEVDVKLAKLGGDERQTRMEEASAFLQAMGQETASTYFYGNAGLNPEEITGLATRFGDLSAENARNIIDAGGTGTDNASIWLVVYGADTVHGIFPKGSRAGIQHQDLGQQTRELNDSAGGNMLEVYRDHFSLETGVVVKDWRFLARLCNIDVSDLVANSGAQAEIVDGMIKMMHAIEDLSKGKACFYMNRTVQQFLDIQRLGKAGAAGLDYKDVDGVWTPTFRGIPIKRVDALLTTEARVV